MKLLWVIQGRLLPVDSGGRIRSTNTLRELRKRHEVTVLSFYRSKQPDRQYEAAFAAEFPDGEAFWLGNSVRSALAYRLPGPATFGLLMELSGDGRARRKIARYFQHGRIDAAVCDFVFAAPLFPQELAVPCVLHEHNVEWAAVASQLRLRTRQPLRALHEWSLARLRRYETAQVRRFHHTLAVSKEDAALFREMAPEAAITAMSTGVDLEEYRPAPLPEGPSPLVVFTGMMSYYPNVDAMRWFVEDIWPQILREVPGARFRIVGRNPADAVLKLASDSVTVTGPVDSVAEHLRDASAVVVPLRSGGGTRLKIYEAMAAGRPIVSTRLGAEGLDVRDGHDIVFAEIANDFATEVVRLLTDREHALSVATAAAETGAKNGWSVVAEQIEAVLDQVVATHRGV